RCIYGVHQDMESLRFNTAILKLIELNNALTVHVNTTGTTPREIAVPLAQMLSPLCPHIAEELWHKLGVQTPITYTPFPVADPAMLLSETIEIPVQINGKLRTRLSASANISDDELRALALADPKIIQALAGATPTKIVIVPQRLINFVL
ncbi:MAG: class I tRNA ligase family protein, partial [Actinobacteria bacterium]|nr:class I tRNA ligase family protein [Actinomycetota bacterium]